MQEKSEESLSAKKLAEYLEMSEILLYYTM